MHAHLMKANNSCSLTYILNLRSHNVAELNKTNFNNIITCLINYYVFTHGLIVEHSGE